MNIIYSTDNNYTRHAGISILSLYDHNRDVKELNVFLIDNGIKEENRRKLNSMAAEFGRTITYIDFEKFKSRLVLNNSTWELPISAYARLFVDEMLPKSVDKVLYLDCDIIINDSLVELWEQDLDGKTIASVEDVASCLFQPETKTEKPYRYFCSGVILIDLVKWRERNYQQRLMQYVEDMKGVVRHHDQTILNGVFYDDCFMLHPRYDAVTPMFIMSYDNMKAYFKLWDNFYTKQEIKEAVKNPAIIHYTSSNVGRPWENKKHPLSNKYRKYWKQSPWKDEPWGAFKPTYDKTTQKVYWMYQHLPYIIIKSLSRSSK